MFTGELHPFQVSAVEAIWDCRRMLVAYGMGCGKTVITIAALEALPEGPYLIVVPASLKWQWAMKLAEFTDATARVVALKGELIDVPVESHTIVIDGTKAKRKDAWLRVWTRQPRYVICSYGSLLTDADQIKAAPWTGIVADEATAVKNFSSKTSKALKKLQPDIRIALTGTPVENKAEEIFSIMSWVDKTVLGRWDLFDASFIQRGYFGQVLRYKNLDLLHQRLGRAMVRKTRHDPEVAPYLPAVQVTTTEVPLDAKTKAAYKVIEADLAAALADLGETIGTFDLSKLYAGVNQRMDPATGRLMSVMQAAQMLLDHPVLLHKSAADYHNETGGGSAYCWELVQRGITDGLTLVPKLAALRGICEDFDGKVIIFSQYARMLPIIRDALGGGAEIYHGKMLSDSRAAAVARFTNDPDCKYFIASEAGGYGLDLPVAEYLVNYDLSYSAGRQSQRDARHVRASSTWKQVYVRNLLCPGTLEVRTAATLDFRYGLAASILDGGQATLVPDIPSLLG